MCFQAAIPLFQAAAPYIALASQVGSVVSSLQGARSQDKAVANAMNAELGRQRAFRNEALSTVGSTATNMTREAQDGRRAETTAELEGKYAPTTSAAIDPGSFAQTGDQAGTVVGRTVADAVRRGLQVGSARARSAAALDSYGRTIFDNGLLLNRSGEELRRIGNNSAGSTGVFNVELDAARQKGSGWNAAADALGGLGSVASAYWLTNGGKAAKRRTTGMTSLPGGQI